MTFLEISNPDFPPIVIEGDANVKVIQGDVNDFESLKATLEQNGYSIISTEKEILTLVIKERI